MAKETNNYESTLKTVSADTKRELIFNNKFSSFEEIRLLVNAPKDATPGLVFQRLLEDKRRCSQSMLKEMFGLSDQFFQDVIDEDWNEFYREIKITEDSIWVLTRDYMSKNDLERERANHIPFTPAQEKLRALLVKHITLMRFEELAETVEEEYGYSILYDLYSDVEENNHISEEDVLDALRTYQAEHQD